MKKIIGFLICVCFLCGCVHKPFEEYDCKIHFIDTGNSDCILIQSDKNVLIDAGDNNDETRIVEYISKQGIDTLDYVVSTHPDADHSGGLDRVVDEFEIGQVFICNGNSDTYTYQSFLSALVENGISPQVPLEKAVFEIGEDTSIQFFNTRSMSEDSNDLSLLVLLQCKEKCALFTGDATSYIEDTYASQFPKIDILKVAHHGSHYSSSLYFLETIHPKYAIICTGENTYGHPTNEVLYNLEEVNSKVYRTDIDGNIVFTILNNKIQVSTKKDE